MVKTIQYRMENGEQVELSLNFVLLYKLRSEDERTYKRLNRVLMKGASEILEIVDLLYGAYKAKNMDGISYEQFKEQMNQDFAYNNNITNRLMGYKKN
nr:MAG TPA: hypothetical protein [Caudoviricetes sp.]